MIVVAAVARALIPGKRSPQSGKVPQSLEWRHPAITRRDLHIILICHQGYQSSLAAAALQRLGLVHATDLDGEFTAWTADGLLVIVPSAAGQDPSG